MEDSRFYKADLDLQLQLIADVLIVQPVSKRRFGVDNLFDLLRQSLALVVDDSTVNLFIGSVFKIILVPQGKENKDKESCWRKNSPATLSLMNKGNFLFNYSHYYLI